MRERARERESEEEIERAVKRHRDMRELREEQRRMKSNVRDLGFAGLKACGGLRDQVCIRRTEGRVKSGSGGKEPGPNTKGKRNCARKAGKTMTQRVRACFAARVQTVTSQPRREKVQVSMQRIARIKHRCRQHNREIGTEITKHDVMVEKARST